MSWYLDQNPKLFVSKKLLCTHFLPSCSSFHCTWKYFHCTFKYLFLQIFFFFRIFFNSPSDLESGPQQKVEWRLSAKHILWAQLLSAPTFYKLKPGWDIFRCPMLIGSSAWRKNFWNVSLLSLRFGPVAEIVYCSVDDDQDLAVVTVNLNVTVTVTVTVNLWSWAPLR